MKIQIKIQWTLSNQKMLSSQTHFKGINNIILLKNIFDSSETYLAEQNFQGKYGFYWSEIAMSTVFFYQEKIVDPTNICSAQQNFLFLILSTVNFVWENNFFSYCNIKLTEIRINGFIYVGNYFKQNNTENINIVDPAKIGLYQKYSCWTIFKRNILFSQTYFLSSKIIDKIYC